MKNKLRRTAYLAIFLILVFIQNSTGALLYTPSQYKAVYNEKVALELELKTLKRQYANQLNILENEKRDLQVKIQELEKRISNLEKKNAEDKDLCDKKISGLENQIKILKQKGSSREKNLLKELSLQRTKYEKQISDLMDKLENERKSNENEINKLNQKYNREIAELNKRIEQLSRDLAYIKKLNKQQKDELERLENQANELEKQLEKEIAKGDIRLKRMHNKLIINIDDKISFDSGSSRLKNQILPALKKISQILSEYPEYQIIIEGHTDNIPIHSAKVKDNWQLSTERALSVLRYLLRNSNLDPKRFSAAGYGEHNPVVPNTSKSNRALNRRVDIVVIPRIESK